MPKSWLKKNVFQKTEIPVISEEEKINVMSDVPFNLTRNKKCFTHLILN